MTGPTAARSTREAWLENAIEELRPRFVEIGFPLPDRIHVSVGFGAFGARQENGIIRGQTWKRVASVDEVNHMFISPEIGDTAVVLAVLIHELVHVALDCEDGHKGRFAEAATRLGLEGKMTTATPGPVLAFELVTMADALGDYPHGRIDFEGMLAKIKAEPKREPVDPSGEPVPAPRIRMTSGPAKQGTRMLKVWCPECDYKVRTTASWLAVAVPACPNPGCTRKGEDMRYAL